MKIHLIWMDLMDCLHKLFSVYPVYCYRFLSFQFLDWKCFEVFTDSSKSHCSHEFIYKVWHWRIPIRHKCNCCSASIYRVRSSSNPPLPLSSLCSLFFFFLVTSFFKKNISMKFRYDMEDAMILNKSSVERGMCRGQIYQVCFFLSSRCYFDRLNFLDIFHCNK